MIMLLSLVLGCCFLVPSYGQSLQQLKDSAATFPPMPRNTVGLLPFVQGRPTFASGTPFNDLEYNILDTDYMDGENSGSDVFLPVDPSDPFPGANRVKYIRCVLNTDLDLAYGAAKADRIILGTHEATQPFFLRGADGIDNDYVVIQHLDFDHGHIQLKGTANDYRLIYGTQADGCQTEGWYLFYVANGQIDLMAFIFPCWDLEAPISGSTPNNPNPYCNADSTLSLLNPNHFRYAQPISTAYGISNGIAQVGSTGKEIVGGLAVDPQGNSYLFGCTDGNLDGQLDASNEIFVVKVSPTGQQLWATELPMSEGTLLKDGLVDGQYLYLCGRTLGNLPGFVSAGKWDGILLKLDINTGQIVASDQWGNAGIDGYGNIAQDDNGNLFVSAQGSPSGGGGNTDDVYLVAKYSKSNLSNVWRVLSRPNTTGFAASAEAWGGLTYAAGTTPGDGRLIAGGWFFSSTGANAFVSVYENLNAATPTRPHSIVINTPGVRADWVLDNVVDTQGNIYVAGYTTGSISSAPNGEGDAYISKYSPQLTNPISVQLGTAKSDNFRKLCIKNDTLYAIGYTYGNFSGNNADPTQRTGDIIIQKFDTNLNLLESQQLGTEGEDRAMATIQGNYLYLGGTTEGAMVAPNQGSFDGFVAAVRLSDLMVEQPIILTTNQTPTVATTLKAYPNPIQDWLQVEVTNLKDPIESVVLLNALGQIVVQQKNLPQALNLENIPTGTYWLQVHTSSETLQTAVIKQ